MSQKDDYDLSEKIKIKFKGMDYYVMPRYTHHYLDNEYEKFSLQILKNNLSAESTFIDIGAHYGAYSLVAAECAGSKVLAVEPVPENFELLNLNVRANHLDGLISTYNYAASDQNGEAEFNIPWASDSAGFYEHPNAETVRKQLVEVRKIDDLVNGQRVDIIKIDTEGHEVSVLKGLAGTLKQNPQAKLIIELNPECLRRAGKSPEELFEVIRSFDKEIYVIDEENFVLSRITDNLDNWKDYLGPDGYSNIYCVPAKGHEFMLFVSHSPLLEGAELALANQINAFRKRGIISHVILPEYGPFAERLINNGISYSIVTVYSFWALSRHGESLDSPDYQYRNSVNMAVATKITAVAKRVMPTAVVNNSIVNPWGYPASRSLGLPLFWMIHEYGDADHNIAFPHDLSVIRKFIVRESELVFCCSDSVRSSMLTGDKSLDSKVHTVYNFIDTNAVIELSQEAKKVKRSKGVQLSIVGTVTEGKGQIVAIRAVAELKNRGVDANLWVIGRVTENYQKYLNEEIRKLGVKENITFLGFMTNPYTYMKSSDAVVVCSPHEAFGRATVEAMLLDVPVIGSNSGGTAETITNNVTGFLFKPLDASDLASQVEKLNTKDITKLTKRAHAHIVAMLDESTLLDIFQTAIGRVKVDPESSAYKKLFGVEWTDATNAFMNRQSEDQTSLENMRAELQQTEARLLQTQQELSRILHSRSWRTTKPLRETAGVLRKLKGRK